MSAPDTEHPYWSPRSAGERILMHLKMRGAQSSADLGATFATTGEAARQQLLKLQEEGLVEPLTEDRSGKGAGRPKQLWRLTAKAQARFPDTHAAMTVDLLQIIRTKLGEEALDEIILARGQQTAKIYTDALLERGNLEDKVAALALLRTREGYMAEWSRQPDGSLLLVENHCPICTAATACQGFCRAELAAFRTALGPDVEVLRQEHLLSGNRRCAYAIISRA